MSERKTHEQFVAEVESLVAEEYTVLGTYKNNSTKILIRHNTCGHEYDVMPSGFLRGRRCPECKRRELRKVFARTQEEFIQEVSDLVGDEYAVLGTYVNNQAKIKMRHNICGLEYEVVPNSFLRGRRCSNCRHKESSRRKAKTHEEFVQDVRGLVDEEYTVLGDYKNSKTKIVMRHNKCGFEFSVAPGNFLKGSRCPKCSRRMKKTTESFKQEIHNLVGDEYVVLGEYVNTDTKTLMRHNECGLEYEVVPSSFLRGSRCPVCQIKIIAKKQTRTHEEFVEKVHDLVGEEYTVLGEYKNSQAKIPMRHNKCGHEFSMKPNNFLTGRRCQNCAGNKRKTTRQFIQEVHDLIGDEYTVTGDYVNAQTKINIAHNTCGSQFSMTPANFLNGQRCPCCFGTPKKNTA